MLHLYWDTRYLNLNLHKGCGLCKVNHPYSSFSIFCLKMRFWGIMGDFDNKTLDLIHGCNERNRTFKIFVAMIKVVTMTTEANFLNSVD